MGRIFRVMAAGSGWTRDGSGGRERRQQGAPAHSGRAHTRVLDQRNEAVLPAAGDDASSCSANSTPDLPRDDAFTHPAVDTATTATIAATGTAAADDAAPDFATATAAAAVGVEVHVRRHDLFCGGHEPAVPVSGVVVIMPVVIVPVVVPARCRMPAVLPRRCRCRRRRSQPFPLPVVVCCSACRSTMEDASVVIDGFGGDAGE